MLDSTEFASMIEASGRKIKNSERAYKAYINLYNTIQKNPEEIDDLLDSCYQLRADYRNLMADMLIEVTPQEIDDLIELIALIKENESGQY